MENRKEERNEGREERNKDGQTTGFIMEQFHSVLSPLTLLLLTSRNTVNTYLLKALLEMFYVNQLIHSLK